MSQFEFLFSLSDLICEDVPIWRKRRQACQEQASEDEEKLQEKRAHNYLLFFENLDKQEKLQEESRW